MRAKRTDWLVYVLVRLVVAIIQAMRIETCERLAGGLAVLASDVLRVRRRVIDENLATAFPAMGVSERRRLAREMWIHLFTMVCEIAHAPRKIHRTNWHDYAGIPERRELVRYLLDPRPLVLISGHFGNFEVGGYVTGLLGFPSFAVARRLDNRYLDRYVNRFRSMTGQFIVSKDGSASAIADLLSSGATLSLLGDQHAGPKGCWIDFFGRPASCHKAIALFPLTSGAPLLVVSVTRRARALRFTIRVEGIADPAAPNASMTGVAPLTQWYNNCLEEAIREQPGQYWWLHRRWKSPPPVRRRQRDSQDCRPAA